MEPKISPGNTKLGKIPNISLPPLQTCVPDAPCREGKCYALKAWRQYPNVRKAWRYNLGLYLIDPDRYFFKIDEYIRTKNVRYFRWHVAGDIPDRKYFVLMNRTAYRNPDILFLCYTKKYQYCSNVGPNNLRLVASAWPGYPMSLDLVRTPIAWLSHDDRLEFPVYKDRDMIKCPNKCDECYQCWGTNKDVVFDIH